LKNLGMGDLQIDELVHTRKFMEDVNIVSPAAAFILVRNVSPGQRFDKGTELFRLADLSRVWILTDVFERDVPLVESGKLARVTVPGRKEAFEATVSQALPQFDNVTRTLKLRLEADNPGFALKPDMFVDVEFAVSLPETLVVPADAVLDAGLRKTVFVDRGNGCFEPRPVETGWRLGESVEIARGLMPGERIVVSGNFLLDSESRMKLAAAGVHGTPTTDPVCGMAVDESKARAASLTSEHAGGTIFFCGDGCKKQFDAEPGRYLNKPVAAAATHASTESHTASPGAAKAHDSPVPMKTEPTGPTERRSKDPVCNMQVEEAEARSAGRFSRHEGREIFFCSEPCKQRFDKDPAQFLKKLEDRAPSPAPAAASPASPASPPPHRDQPPH
jgi:YHS domain-containing protein